MRFQDKKKLLSNLLSVLTDQYFFKRRFPLFCFSSTQNPTFFFVNQEVCIFLFLMLILGQVRLRVILVLQGSERGQNRAPQGQSPLHGLEIGKNITHLSKINREGEVSVFEKPNTGLHPLNPFLSNVPTISKTILQRLSFTSRF